MQECYQWQLINNNYFVIVIPDYVKLKSVLTYDATKCRRKCKDFPTRLVYLMVYPFTLTSVIYSSVTMLNRNVFMKYLRTFKDLHKIYSCRRVYSVSGWMVLLQCVNIFKGPPRLPSAYEEW